jgi:hypothetical protein
MRQIPCYSVSGASCRRLRIRCRRPYRRYRIKPARMERMAPAKPPYGEPATSSGPVHSDSLKCVCAAGRVEAAARTKERADDLPVSGNQPCKQPRRRRHFIGLLSVGPTAIIHTAPPCRRSSARTTTSSSAAKSACLAVAAWGLARNTSRLPLGSACRYPEARCLSRRLTWLRTTAWPTARLTMKPTLAGSSISDSTARCPTSSGRPNRLPRRIATVKSVRRRIRATAGSIARHRHRDGAALVRR